MSGIVRTFFKSANKIYTGTAALVLLLSQTLFPIAVIQTAYAAPADDIGKICTVDALSPCIDTDKDDYTPTDTVQVHGFGYLIGDAYSVVLTAEDDATFSLQQSVVADQVGGFTTSFTLDGVFRPVYNLQVVDSLGSVVATDSFSDSRVINWASLNDVTVVHVDPSDSISAKVNVTTSASSDDWRCTAWSIPGSGLSGTSNSINVTNDDTRTHTFSITAPATYGTYSVVFTAYADNGCSSLPSTSFTLSNAIVVQNNNPVPIDNPPLSMSCGLDIALVIDNSNSIDSGELATMKNAMTAFTNALAGTPTQFSVTRFGSSSQILQTFTANISDVNNAINSVSTGGGLTNWEDALIDAGSTLPNRPANPDLVLFSSDGNPTTSNTGSGSGTSAHLNPAIVEANNIKATGARILALGIGNPTIANLKAISGPNVNTGDVLTSDVITSDFNQLAADLAEFAAQTCGGTITVQKLIDADNNLQTTNDQTPGGSWQFDVNGSPSNPDPVLTDTDGFTPAIDVSAGTYSVSETLDPSNPLLSATCNGATDNGTASADGVQGLDISNLDIVSCVFINGTPQEATLVLSKTVVNNNGGLLSASDFPVLIDGQSASWGSNTVIAGDYTVTETNQPGYQSSVWGGDCDAQGNVSLEAGETKTCTITNDDIAPVLKVVKHVVNDNGGNNQAGDFQMVVDGINVANPNFAGSEAGVSTELSAGPYEVSEVQLDGYSASYSGDCSGVIAIGETKTCTITNNDQAPVLTLLKDISLFDNNGPALPSNFTLHLSGGGYDGTEDFTTGATPPVAANTSYGLSEEPYSGYELNKIDCYDDDSGLAVNLTPQNSLTLNEGQHVTCTFFNDDIAPKLIVTKIVSNQNGGTLQVSDFPLFVNGNLVVSGQQNDFDAGQVLVSETNQDGYIFTGFGGDCGFDGSLSLEVGGVYSCMLYNEDDPATITVSKEIVNNHGGQAGVSNFELYVNDVKVSNGTLNTVPGNTAYTISEKALVSGYEQTSLTCWDVTDPQNPQPIDNGFTALLAHDYACEIVNDDIAPTLTLEKTVVTDDGGNATADDFQAYINGDQVTWGESVTIKANELLQASEDNLKGYAAGEWTGDCAADGTVTLQPGENATCSIVNDDIAPQLTIVKHVTNDDGGTLLGHEFAVMVNSSGLGLFDSQSTVDDVSTTTWVLDDVLANTDYSVSEQGLPTYSFEGLDCRDDDSGLAVQMPVVLNEAQHVTCTLYNDDIAGSLTLQKTLVTDDGGDALPSEWVLHANYNNVSLNQAATNFVSSSDDTKTMATDTFMVPAGSYDLSESDGPDGYSTSGVWQCTNGEMYDADTVTIPLNTNVTCTIVNDDEAPRLNVSKYVINDNGGDMYAENFVLRVNGDILTDLRKGGSGPISGGFESSAGYLVDGVMANTPYDVSEDSVFGYENFSFECKDDDTDTIVSTPVVLNEGQSVSCLFKNDDMAPTITLVKDVTNNDGGQSVPANWTLTAESSEQLISGNGTGQDASGGVESAPFRANTQYTLGESGPDGYELTGLSCQVVSADGGIDFADNLLSASVGTGVECRFSNNDMAPHLSLYKAVTDEYGSGYDAADWTLMATPQSYDYGATEISGNGYNGVVDKAAKANVIYQLSESGPDGFTPSDWTCLASDPESFQLIGDELEMEVDSDVNCYITNEANAPQLIVVKQVVNDDHVDPSSGLQADNFTIYVDGTDVSDPSFSGQGLPGTVVTLDVGSYEVYEDAGELAALGYSVIISEDCSSTIKLGEIKVCTVTNDDIAPTLTIQKFAHSLNTDQTPQFAFSVSQDSQVWQPEINYDFYASASANSVTLDGSDGLKAGSISINELVAENWYLDSVSCERLNGLDGIADVRSLTSPHDVDLTLKPGDNVVCEFTNNEYASLQVTKFWDVNQNGFMEETENGLEGWTINLQTIEGTDNIVNPYLATGGTTVSQDTGETGMTVFDGIVPDQYYWLSENLPDEWNLSGMYCFYQSEVDSGYPNGFNRFVVTPQPGERVDCYIGDYRNSELLIEKTNDQIGNELNYGDEVLYTITITNPQASGISFDTVAYDIMPDGVTYIADSGVATSSVRGEISNPLDTSDYVADGPATWQLGDLAPGEVVTLQYSATIDDGIELGTYENVAFAEGYACQNEQLFKDGIYNIFFPFNLDVVTSYQCEDSQQDVANVQSADSEDSLVTAAITVIPRTYSEKVSVLANVVTDEDSPFVRSPITIVAAAEEQGFVLGILSVTGTPAILPTAVGLITLLTAAVVAGGESRRKRRLFSKLSGGLKQLVLVALLMLLFSGRALATSDSQWQLSVVDLPDSVSSSDIEFSYSVLSVNGDDQFDVRLLQDGVEVDTASVATPYGDNGTLDVMGLDDGTYEFVVEAAIVESSQVKMVTQTVEVDTKVPSAPDYTGVSRSGNTYTLTFTVTDSDAKTVKIYASTSTEFTASEDNLVGTVTATPGSEQTFVYTAPDDSTRYFALLVVDDANNQSSIVGDEQVVVRQPTTTTAPTSTTTEENVLGEESEESTNGESTGEQTEQTNDDETGTNGWLIALIGAAIVGLGYLYFVRSTSEE